MDWQLVAIWILVAAVVVWFFRDERRVQRERLQHQARYFALAPAYRHVAASDA